MIWKFKGMAAAIVLAAGLCVSGAGLPNVARAQSDDAGSATTDGPSEQEAASEKLMATLHPVQGQVKLPDANATLVLGKAYYFLNAEEARRIIVDVWGNPPDQAEGVLGLIVPEGRSPINDWGAIVSYEDTGYVSDHDAETTDYGKYIKDIQASEADENKARKEAGYGATHLVGWAQTPSYDKVAHSMVWARNIQFEGSEVNSLNYDIRLLGRKGVLSINMIATMPELPAIHQAARDLAQTGRFDDGYLYSQYQEGDAKAAYGVGGMVAAGLGLAAAKKFGLLAVLMLVLKKGWFVLLLAAGAVKAWVGKLFGKKTSAAPAVAPAEGEVEEDAEPSREDVSAVTQSAIVEDASGRRD